MKIRAVELTNFRKFVGTVRVESIGDNVNVLVGQNELGKSTLLQAINGVIFEKARSNAAHVKAFRHFVNGTVPEVKLTFDLDGKIWTIHKRFAGANGRAVLTSSTGTRFEDDQAEAELQRLLGFTGGGRSGGEPGIWGTLWVQQGQSFGDMALSEQAQRTIQGCLEAQVGLVTGGTRGQKIPKSVREALDAIQNQRGPRGRYKEAVEQLATTVADIGELENKVNTLSSLLTDLARNRRDMREAHANWDEATHRTELDQERGKRIVAATAASEVASARDAAGLARERADHARKALQDRNALIAEVEMLARRFAELEQETASAQGDKEDAQTLLKTAEDALADLRAAQRDNAELSRKLERLRATLALQAEIERHQNTLDKAIEFETEILRLTELIGSIAASDAAVRRVEAAMAEMAAAQAATDAVATIVSFEILEGALVHVAVDGAPLRSAQNTLKLLKPATITVAGIGSLRVDPQVNNQSVLTQRHLAAADALKTSLDSIGVSDLAAAQAAAAQRREHERSLAHVQQQLSGLAPGDRKKGLAAGQDALKTHLSQLRGQLKSELAALNLVELPAEEALTVEIAAAHQGGERLSTQIATSEAALSGPRDRLAQAEERLRKCEKSQSELQGTIGTRYADLQAMRDSRNDAALSDDVSRLERDASEKEQMLVRKEHLQGDSVEGIDARIKRLEGAGVNYERSVATLTNVITRLSALVQANEGNGVEEQLVSRQADRDRLSAAVTSFEEEAAVLQLLLQTLETAESEAKSRYLAPVVGRVQPYLKMLLPNSDIVFDENLGIAGLQRDGQTEDYGVLSGGTQEQLAVLTRIAFAELLLGQGRPATVILDDALAFSDDDRIERMFDVLMRAGGNVQIIVLTCRKKLFTRLGAAPLEIQKVAN